LSFGMLREEKFKAELPFPLVLYTDFELVGR
jgi:hypothetical protein